MRTSTATIVGLTLLLCLGLSSSHSFGGKLGGGGYSPVYTSYVPYPVAQPVPVPQPIPVPVAVPQPIPVPVPQPVVVPFKHGWKGGLGGLGGLGGFGGGGFGGYGGGYSRKLCLGLQLCRRSFLEVLVAAVTVGVSGRDAKFFV
ncbi:GL21517 [Drosophila persimilis]|uniref:GL21517 n=1 Tax=Drosophila persimilis TaxID=7234 RepID=B4GDP6_DROPE|nr:GL21517 [Drosophila persimilis]